MEEEKMEKSVNDVIAEVIGRSDLRPRGRWILTKDTAAPPSKKVEMMEENNETINLGSCSCGDRCSSRGGLGGAWLMECSQLLNLMTSSAHMVIEGCGGDGDGEGEGEGRDAYLHEMVMVEIVCVWRS
ncbi:Hypothetical predicted protein [Olea europaea subsp. europaea]|uniref:Uncharacterized protein n=1 Tax=Olea europaea subsp. europaea TaxID=158383 RepID=A0A8S0QYY5_OLEEU|nr:Hypothetical predicted protein [Olea europaea subsp. europaea]